MKEVAKRWGLFLLSIVLMGIWFPLAIFRADERPFFHDNFGLTTRRGAGAGDSVQEAFEDIGKDGRWAHSIKNILHEWTRENPKRAAKFLSFLVILEAIALLASLPAIAATPDRSKPITLVTDQGHVHRCGPAERVIEEQVYWDRHCELERREAPKLSITPPRAAIEAGMLAYYNFDRTPRDGLAEQLVLAIWRVVYEVSLHPQWQRLPAADVVDPRCARDEDLTPDEEGCIEIAPGRFEMPPGNGPM